MPKTAATAPDTEDDERVLVPLVVRVDEAVFDALNAWARSEERSCAAQTRIALRGVIPDEFFANGTES
jgi:hypothetical protein